MRLRAVCIIALLLIGAPALALEPDQLLLLVNKNIPESRKLAQYYATKRHVPPGRILELDLPEADDVPFDVYEARVVSIVRRHLVANALQDKIKCLVTFYGVPLKVAARINTADDRTELAALRRAMETATAEVINHLKPLEAKAAGIDPDFKPKPGDQADQIAGRADAAIRAIVQKLTAMPDVAARDEIWRDVQKLAAPLSGPAVVAQGRLNELAALGDKVTPEQLAIAGKIREELAKLKLAFDQLQNQRHEPKARAALREIAAGQLGPIEHLRLLKGMIEYFATENTDAAFDSELAAVAWNFPVRTNSLVNPMWYRTHTPNSPQTFMTARLDGPLASSVRELINATLQAEADGLKGSFVVDAGGHLNIDANNITYSTFDAGLKNLAQFAKDKSALEVILDDKKELITARSLKNIALYTGWYQLRQYAPPGTFATGAVAFHVASYEMCSLHAQGETGWCRGLLGDGVVATIGATNEPLLNAFPDPNEFFALLMTGKLTLAEAYWRTTPTVGWRMAMVGDPLYMPFKNNPAIKPDALPPRLQKTLPQNP